MQAAERAANKNQTPRQLQGGTAKRKRKSEAATVQRNRPKQQPASSNKNRRHPDTRTTAAEPGTAIKVLQFMGRLAGAQAPLAAPRRAKHRRRQLKFLAN